MPRITIRVITVGLLAGAGLLAARGGIVPCALAVVAFGAACASTAPGWTYDSSREH